jgi:hypothetical protein
MGNPPYRVSARLYVLFVAVAGTVLFVFRFGAGPFETHTGSSPTAAFPGAPIAASQGSPLQASQGPPTAPPLCQLLNASQRCKEFEEVAGISIEAGPTYLWNPAYTDNPQYGWGTGNKLSMYWNARAMAHLAGAAFKVGPHMRNVFDTTFLKYLPMQTTGFGCANPLAYASACQGCTLKGHHKWLFTFPHECNGAWTFFLKTIALETRSALKAWHQSRNVSEQVFAPGDVVVQYRCAADTLLLAHG